ncbi:COP1-interactive protein 1-like [Helianthus annuus]|uniref:COP1-interactive protein 1-like n=1 Tax=Helianthus annuus TaxID=4232 RepID=UPI000B903235|nr:COP1-interactive protein 1-like [Helianthus annuus]
MREEVEQEKLIRKRKREEKEDAPYVPSPEHVSASQSTPRDLFDTSPLTQVQPGSSGKGLPIPQDNLLDVDFDIANNSQVLKLEKRIEDVIAENKKLVAESKKIADREKILVGRVQKLEGENKVLTQKVKADQMEIDILKVRVSELEEEKNRREIENEYYKLKNKELTAAKALHEHKFYMLNRVVESMLETSVEQKYEELKLEDLRAERQAELERQMKDKGKGVEGSSEMSIVPSMVIDNPEPISAVPDLFEEETPTPKLIGGSGVRVTEASNEKVVEDLLNDTINEESGEAEGKGESSKTQIVEHHEPLFVRLEEYKEMLKNQDYKYDYVEDADIYDRVEVEECSDNEEVPEDTSKLPTLMEFFAAENRDELRQKVTEAVNDNVFECLRKEAEQEGQSNVDKEGQSKVEEIDRSKWFKDSHERKFKRPLKFFQRDRNVSLGDIISWGFLPQVNAYAIRREYGV